VCRERVIATDGDDRRRLGQQRHELRVADGVGLTGKSLAYDQIVSVELGVTFRAWEFCCHLAVLSAWIMPDNSFRVGSFWISRARAAVLRSPSAALKDVGNVTPVSKSFRPSSTLLNPSSVNCKPASSSLRERLQLAKYVAKFGSALASEIQKALLKGGAKFYGCRIFSRASMAPAAPCSTGQASRDG
jgi:hypothetical protein